MPGSWRPTHRYPNGKPRALVFINSAFASVCLLWVFFAGRHLWLALMIIAAAVGIALIDSRLHQKYERTGAAVRIVYPSGRHVSFPEGIPLPLRVLRIGFFVLASVLIALGLAPIPWSVARVGRIAIVSPPVAVGVVHLFLEAMDVSRGKWMDIERLN